MKRLLAYFAALVVMLPAVAATTAEQVFVNAPTWLIPGLDRNARLDMLDYYHAGSSHAIRNALDGRSRVVSASDMQVTIATSAASEMQIALLPAKNDTIIMVINTMRLPGNAKPTDPEAEAPTADDSSADFYTRSWKPINRNIFKAPSLDDWTRRKSGISRQDLENAAPIMLSRITYDPETRLLTVTNSLGIFLPEEEGRIVNAALLPALTYRWAGSHFTRVKQKNR